VKRPFGHIPLVVAVLLHFSLGCDDEQPTVCPGTTIGEFLIEAAPISGTSTCGFVPESSSTRAIVSWDSAETGRATLCPTKKHATPLAGEHSGDRITLTSSATSAPLERCGSTCTANVDQRIELEVVRDNDGVVTGLTGSLLESLSGPTECTGNVSGVVCTLPCEIHYTLAGTE
jgi:hypothetical protein